ncbi:MAG: hypothetical protein M1411_02370 [Candidatus Thermoplasmatota archaeon]|jgi:tetratricopeptide (TPR) repeat protein|nr:hypothetical protein [Candidatus Thermoplasmatota archaeon]
MKCVVCNNELTDTEYICNICIDRITKSNIDLIMLPNSYSSVELLDMIDSNLSGLPFGFSVSSKLSDVIALTISGASESLPYLPVPATYRDALFLNMSMESLDIEQINDIKLLMIAATLQFALNRNYEVSKKIYEMVLKLDSYNRDALISLSILNSFLNDIDAGRGYLERVNESGEHSLEYLYALAMVSTYDESIKYLNNIIEKNPMFAEAVYFMNELLLSRKDYEKAFKYSIEILSSKAYPYLVFQHIKILLYSHKDDLLKKKIDELKGTYMNNPGIKNLNFYSSDIYSQVNFIKPAIRIPEI